MNDGVNTTPEQAARSLRIVRLVSFGASLALCVVALLVVATLTYAPLWPQTDPPRIAVVSEVVRERVEAPVRAPPRVTPPPLAPGSQAAPSPEPAPEPPTVSEPVVITNPVWIERPLNPERFYPREAFMQGVAGEVVLACEVDVTGRLTCVVASETPQGRGFGDAALRIASAHVMRPAMRNGAPAPGRYRMVVPFSPAG